MNLEDELTGDKAQAANECCKAVMVAVAPFLLKMDCGGEKATLLAGAAIPTLAGITALFSHPATYDRVCKPGPDEMIFGACYIIATSELHSEGMIMGYSPDIVLKTIELFKKVTGRDYSNIHPALREVLDEYLAEGKDVPDSVKKFVS